MRRPIPPGPAGVDRGLDELDGLGHAQWRSRLASAGRQRALVRGLGFHPHRAYRFPSGLRP